MKGRKALYLATLASILLIAGGVMLYSVYKNNPSADSFIADGNIDAATLSQIAASQTPNEPVIQLNYTKAQIETALSDYPQYQFS
jgi:hypothetical protein